MESATWEREASTELSIDAGGQVIPVRISQRSVLTARFRPEGADTRVSLVVEDFEGRMTNPMAPEVTATEGQIDGSVEFLLDRRGRPTILSLPTTSGGAAQLFDGWELVHGFVPRFPEGGVAPGATWADTISYAPEGSGMTGTVRQVVRYAAAGDSVIEGRSYRVIRAESDDRVEQRGATGGMQIAQTLEGTSTHLYLWDEEAGVLHSAQVESTLSGSMNVDVAPMPLGVRARGTSTLVRR